jgi:hypothetical protein
MGGTVPGDEAQPEIQGGAPQLRTGPRHAAPRKSLLTRVHVPAGKAIALAAMPTAVLMGMGLTPRLAQAAEPKNPFSGDHCVSQTDSPSPDASSSAKPSASPSPSASATHQPSAKPTASPDAAHSTKPSGAGQPSPSATSAPASSSSKSSDPTDPLGLGSVVGGLLGGLTGSGSGGSGDSTPKPTTSPTPSATPKPTQSAADGKSGDLGSTVGGLTKTLTGVTKGVTDGVSKAVGSVASPSPSVTQGEPYPCPTYDAKALAAAGLEQTPSLLPNQPWLLKSDMLKLTGLKYDGIVKVETENGTVKDVLKFTATGVDIHNLHQIVQGPQNTLQNVQAGEGTTSTIRNGTVTMYTEELKGNLLGLIPIDFTPQSPPPLTIPTIFFTNVTVTQAGQFGGTLTVPGMHAFGSPGSI